MTEPVSTESKGRVPLRRVGVVTSNKMQKTIAVRVERLVRHSDYGKIQRRSTVLKAHDEDSKAQIGDEVEVQFTRPLSKTKRWRLVRIVKAAGARA